MLDLDRDQEKALLGVALIIGGGFLLLIFTDSGGEDGAAPAQEDNGLSYASSMNDTVAVSNEEASKVFMIEDYGVDPYRRNIELGENVAFQNNRDDRIVVSFDRSPNEIILEPGERTSLQVTGTTYADLEASDGWEGEAQIYME